MHKLFYTLRTHYPSHFKSTISLSVPVIVAQLGLVLMGVIDNMMIGDIGYEFLSAASLANSIYFILTVIGIGITFAISALVAEADASEKLHMCGRYLGQGIWVSIITAIILGLLVWIATLVLPYMNQPEQDVILATPYLRILAVSILPMLLFLAFKQFSDGLSLTRPAMYITLAGLGFNTLANWLLIYGNWGFPRLELIGAGYGTLASRIFMMILIIGYILGSSRFSRYKLTSHIWKFHFPTIAKIVRIGLPSGMQYFFEVGAFGGAVLMIGLIGTVERSAHQIVISMASITYMVTTGFAAGAAIRVGNALGR
ncbi:MAG: MATE family efflux transporter, partial [Bacteroidota bacterium]